MKSFLLTATLLLPSSIQLTPYSYVAIQTKLRQDRSVIDSVVNTFAIANKVNVATFRYAEFNQAMSNLHPALMWITLRYLSERSTGARKDHIELYLRTSEIIAILNKALVNEPKAVVAIEAFEYTAATRKLNNVDETTFLNIVDLVIQELQSEKI